jgi:hypothetical protein
LQWHPAQQFATTNAATIRRAKSRARLDMKDAPLQESLPHPYLKERHMAVPGPNDGVLMIQLAQWGAMSGIQDATAAVFGRLTEKVG